MDPENPEQQSPPSPARPASRSTATRVRRGRPSIAAVEGRVLDPATAITVDGVTPAADRRTSVRGWSSRSRSTSTAPSRCSRAVAEPLGWDVVPRGRGPAHGEPEVRRPRRPARASAPTGRRSPPTAGRCCQQTRAQFGVDAVRGVGLDHVVFTDPFDGATPTRRATRSTGHPFDAGHPYDGSHPSTAAATTRPVSTYGVARQRRPPAGRLRRARRRSAVPPSELARPAPGRGDPRHRLRRAPVARRRRRHATSTLDGAPIGYDDAASPTPRPTATWPGRSTA